MVNVEGAEPRGEEGRARLLGSGTTGFNAPRQQAAPDPSEAGWHLM